MALASKDLKTKLTTPSIETLKFVVPTRHGPQDGEAQNLHIG